MTSKNQDALLLGHTISLVKNPFETDPLDSCVSDSQGGILVRDGKIYATDTAEDLKSRFKQAKIVDYGTKLILPGFLDAHVHYPQTAIIASWGKRLIDWLNDYTFPEEMKFHDPVYAKAIAERYLDLAISHGTTTCATYATIHPQSVEAIFQAAETRGMSIVAGKTCMDRNAPNGLMDTAQSAYDDSKHLLEKWHGKNRCVYAITPRFAPTSTQEQLNALGQLWAEHPDCLMQTHLSEQVEEISWVKSLYPQARDYLDIYQAAGLFGDRAIYGHAIHLEAREKDEIKEIGAALVHCPTSNTFIGSGLFDMAGLTQTNQRIGLASDTGGGSSFSMLRTMAAAYEVGQLNAGPMHPANLLWLATMGSAQALHLDDEVGSLDAGKYADVVVLDLHSTPAIAQRANMANDIWSALFPTIMMGDDRAIFDVWIKGKRIKLADQT
jgi:guanine deaminase